MNRALFALLTAFVVSSALGESPEPTKVRITTWNLEWFPNGSAHDATPEVQAQRIAAAADVLRPFTARAAEPLQVTTLRTYATWHRALPESSDGILTGRKSN